MMLAAALVSLKQHRFEIAVAVIIALATGAWALVVDYRLDALHVPTACIDNWLARANAPEGASACAAPMRAWGEILTGQGEIFTGQGVLPLSLMGMLPFAIGLLGGVPIVAREIEARTAQTAWSLNGSRLRWLLRQAAPVLILVGFAVAFAAMAASILEVNRDAWGRWGYYDLGLHGPLVVARAFGAFGVGILIGALLGRTLPAFVFGVLLSLAIVFGVGIARDAWVARLQPVVVGGTSAATGEVVTDSGALVIGYAWKTPSGQQISDGEAMSLVPPDVAAKDDPEQPVSSTGWLQDHGYKFVALGVTEEMALGWAPYDALLFGLVGLGSFGGAIVLVNRRRPT